MICLLRLDELASHEMFNLLEARVENVIEVRPYAC